MLENSKVTFLAYALPTCKKKNRKKKKEFLAHIPNAMLKSQGGCLGFLSGASEGSDMHGENAKSEQLNRWKSRGTIAIVIILQTQFEPTFVLFGRQNKKLFLVTAKLI